ncbi:hypothetical protein M011DRAFT_53287 [Sporormia fimetaria CBS 119925]|uniref:F-box domain-containing protein n=1 Tax=Sporormia fimetaria CBS 119925 TaxID=1340428 RepID=A0A6A6V9G2_9PLEO|nr:hypothetical protein M011DRAFT_53287 [Sporormia fimetaria CBS 119925]
MSSKPKNIMHYPPPCTTTPPSSLLGTFREYEAFKSWDTRLTIAMNPNIYITHASTSTIHLQSEIQVTLSPTTTSRTRNVLSTGTKTARSYGRRALASLKRSPRSPTRKHSKSRSTLKTDVFSVYADVKIWDTRIVGFPLLSQFTLETRSLIPSTPASSSLGSHPTSTQQHDAGSAYSTPPPQTPHPPSSHLTNTQYTPSSLLPSQSDDEVSTSINDLPTELLLLVFEELRFFDLCICGKVCRRWAGVVGGKRYWECGGW